MAKILVVDDDEVNRQMIREVLEKEKYTVHLAESGERAVQSIRNVFYDVILSDIRMMEVSGMGVLRAVKRHCPESVVVLMTGFGSMEGAIEAIQEGAFDYVSKPFKMTELRTLVNRAVIHRESLRGVKQNDTTSEFLAEKTLIGKSPNIVEVYKILARAAMSSSTVLINGESGTGKELVARAVHDNGPRRSRKFIAVNCGALAENLLESELFGHVKGSFTGAISDKIGLFEEASGGTLFLDEVGDISPALQIRLLRVLQESELKPVGSSEVKKVNVRVIAATHRNLEELVKIGKFREDLFYRLKVISIELPPLRERMEDLPDLVGHFLAKYAIKNKKHVSHLSDEVMTILKSYQWPGNIRELEHAIERAVAMSKSSVLFPEDFPPEIFRKSQSETSIPKESATHSLEDLEKRHILDVLNDVNYNKSKASEILGIDRATLYRKAQRLGIDLRGKSGW